MRRIAVAIVPVAILVLAAGCAGVSVSRVEELEDRVATLEAGTGHLQNAVADQEANLESATSRLVAMVSSKEAEREARVEALGEKVERLVGAARSHYDDIAAVQERIGDLNDYFGKLRKALGALQVEVEAHKRMLEEEVAITTPEPAGEAEAR